MSELLDRLRGDFPDLSNAFFAMRQQAIDGPLDNRVRELIIVAGLAATKSERGFRVHVHRALRAGATAEEIKQAVVLMLGSTTGLSSVVDAIGWADEELATTGAATAV